MMSAPASVGRPVRDRRGRDLEHVEGWVRLTVMTVKLEVAGE